MRRRAAVSALCAAMLLAGLIVAPAHGQQGSVQREARMARDQQALRDRIARLESSGRHTELLESVEALIIGRSRSNLDFDGWTVMGHELNFVWEFNHPDPAHPQGPVRALDFDREYHPLNVFTRYARELAEHDIDLLVVPVPNRVQVWSDRLPDMRPQEDGCGGDLASARLFLALSEAGVEVVDLMPAFSAERGRPREGDDFRLYRNYNPHWAPRGVVIAADVIADRVRQMEWFEPGPHRAGVHFFQSEKRLEHSFPEHGEAPKEPRVFHFERVLDASGRRVEQSDKSSPILVLGDSFSDIYRAEGAGISSQLYARLGYELDRIAVAHGGANSVWQSVARRENGLNGKKLVIWLFRASELGNPDLRSVEIFVP